MAENQHLIAMKGFPATGKSVLATGLSRALAWPVIDKDDIKDYTLNLEDGNVVAYEIMWSVTRRQLALGLSVIVDSPLTYPEAYAAASQLSETYGANLLIVETVLNEDVWRQRLEQRDPSQSAHKIAGWNAMQEMLVRYDGCWKYPIPAPQHLVIDASQPVEVSLGLVLAELRHTQETGPSDATPLGGALEIGSS